jgi:hypothetical protein
VAYHRADDEPERRDDERCAEHHPEQQPPEPVAQRALERGVRGAVERIPPPVMQRGPSAHGAAPRHATRDIDAACVAAKISSAA